MTDQHSDDTHVNLATYATIVVLIGLMAILFLAVGTRLWTAIWVSMLVSMAALIAFLVWSSTPTDAERAQRQAASGWLFPADADVAMNDGPGTFQYEVVGESHYLDNLQQIISSAGLKVDEPGEFYCQAFLFCEPGNQFNPNAVAVVIELKCVGYIPRADAQELAPKLRLLANTGTKDGLVGQVLCVQACIGWSGPERIGVRLDLEDL